MKSPPRMIRMRRRLLRWFSAHRRDLPWRLTRDPYQIAVSEIMLQQTQVDRVVPKYQAWLRRWPTVQRLSKASLRDVLSAWSGLGYNSRGLRLRLLAQSIVEQHKGKFPTDLTALESLPGVGPYTARAIASFAWRENVAVIDTNVRRVISRFWFGVRGVHQRQLQKVVEQFLPSGRSHDWNAALMDFGSAICTSQRPKCDICPLQKECRAYPAILTQRGPTVRPQSPFKDSNRYWRGEIMRTLLSEGALSRLRLQKLLLKRGLPAARLPAILTGLVRDNIISIESGSVLLAETV